MSGKLEAAGSAVPVALDASARLVKDQLERAATGTVDQRRFRHEPKPVSQRPAARELHVNARLLRVDGPF